MDYEVFSSDLGWMALGIEDGAAAWLTFGHVTRAEAEKAVKDRMCSFRVFPRHCIGPSGVAADIATRLRAYASGKREELGNVPIAMGTRSDFQRAVLLQCRKIPYGRTLSYGELAAKAGFPRAARAAGRCMARNPLPLLIPCHRVVCSGGQLGKYSPPGGVEMKRRLLAMESKKGE